MSPARAAAYLVGGVLLAAWLASAAGVTRSYRGAPLPRRSADAVQMDAVVSRVQSQASRLRERLATAPAPRTPVRNPFSFADRPVRTAAVTPRLEIMAPPPALVREPAGPELMLLGIAEQGAVRTAMMSLGEELLMATEGQTVAARYRVGQVGTDTVELTDIETGATRRLSLKSPTSRP